MSTKAPKRGTGRAYAGLGISSHRGEQEAQPGSPEKPITLEDLVSRITPENRHPEVDWGPDVGRERIAWRVPRARRTRRRPLRP